MDLAKNKDKILKIDGNDRTIRQILSKEKYKIDVYQREYKWEEEHIVTLIDDLSSKFITFYDPKHDRSKVKLYPPYFLGSFIINQKDGIRYIVDGQQRLTSLTLLLIYFSNLSKSDNIEITNVDDLIYSESFGKKSFNIDIPDRRIIMDRIYHNEKLDDLEDLLESQINLIHRYKDIEDSFPEELKKVDVLPYFIDWLIEKVIMVEIMTYDENDAYTIFETMNDRGLNLNPTDMLKGYLLTNIEGEEDRNNTNELWKKRLTTLIEYDKKEQITFFKNWLRAKYAKDIREGRKGAINKDFENIDKYHRWVRDKRKNKDFNLINSDGFSNFAYNRFDFFSTAYLKILDGIYNFRSGFEILFYNDYHTFAFQEMIILSAINYDDSEEIIKKKIQLISSFIEMFIIFRKINRRTLGYSSIKYTIFTRIIKNIRNKDIYEIKNILVDFIDSMDEHWEGFDDFCLSSQYKGFVKFLLARMTQYIEEEIGINSSVKNYMISSQKVPFEIEHLLPNKYELYKDYFNDSHEYNEYRNKIGALILIPKGFNQSFNASSYEDKVKHYDGQNILARSLNPLCYEKNPNFLNYITKNDMPFKPHIHMYKEDIDQRTDLYKKICQKIWDTSKFEEIIED